jgi:hypothetical protein
VIGGLLLTNLPPPAFPDGVHPVFVEVGAVPTAGNAPYPPGSIARFGTTYYLQRGTLAAPVWSALSSVVAQDLSALTGLAKLTAGVFSAGAAGVDYAVPDGVRGLYLPIGLALATLSNDANLSVFFDDFLLAASTSSPAPWLFGNGGSGAIATNAVGTLGGGWWRLNTGATASSSAIIRSTSGLIGPPGTKKWWAAWRFAMNTAITAQTIAYAGLLNLAFNKTIGIGVFGAASTVNFQLQYDGNETGSFVSTGVAIDTSVHLVEMWGVGDGKVHARMDGGADLGATTMAAAPTDSMCLQAGARNGTDAVARQIDLDWTMALASRA